MLWGINLGEIWRFFVHTFATKSYRWNAKSAIHTGHDFALRLAAQVCGKLRRNSGLMTDKTQILMCFFGTDSEWWIHHNTNEFVPATGRWSEVCDVWLPSIWYEFVLFIYNIPSLPISGWFGFARSVPTLSICCHSHSSFVPINASGQVYSITHLRFVSLTLVQFLTDRRFWNHTISYQCRYFACFLSDLSSCLLRLFLVPFGTNDAALPVSCTISCERYS